MSIVDTEVSRAMIDVIQNAIHIAAAFGVVISVNPWLMIPAAFVGFSFYFASLFFIKTTRSIKRLEAISLSSSNLLSNVSFPTTLFFRSIQIHFQQGRPSSVTSPTVSKV